MTTRALEIIRELGEAIHCRNWERVDDVYSALAKRIPQLHSTQDIDQAIAIYREYPRKVGRPYAVKCIIRAIREHGFDLVMAKTKEYSQYVQGKEVKIPHPSTWFNQERFMDESSTWAYDRPTAEVGLEIKAEMDDLRRRFRSGTSDYVNDPKTGQMEPNWVVYPEAHQRFIELTKKLKK